MSRRLLIMVFILLVIAFIMPIGVNAQEENRVYVLKATGPLTPTMVEYLERGIEQAQREGGEALIFQIDTPGGSIDLMNRMVQAIRGSQIPVVVYVAPRGAIAGSAGTVITLAGHLAVMAPETAIGAASPVGMQGEDLGDTIEIKEKEILKATVRSLAAHRGKEATDLAEATIESAKAVSAQEALDAGLVDFIAGDIESLLNQIDGEKVDAHGERVLHTANSAVTEVSQNFIEQFLQVLTNPNIVFLLLSVGVQAILIEISQPGGWIAGFIGIVCLALGTYGLGVLPVNWFGLIFIITAFVLFILEIKAPTHGALTAAGLTSFVIGFLVLFNSPTTPSFWRVSVPLVIGTGIAIAIGFLTLLTFVIRAQLRPVEVGAVSLVGRTAEARSDLSPAGMVQVAGELWSARLEDDDDEVTSGDRVDIIGVDGIRLRVRPWKKKGS
ncbi:MAG: nodulation protein NfeD [Anaerolineales bacterium]|nr:nodulation protein NfeD [Anaerolineales bacterium]MCK5634232.1 nodulation protein NfeD [Anaerolineales bacterium]